MKKFFEPEPVIFSTGGGTPLLLHDTIDNMRNSIKIGADVVRSNLGLTSDKKIVLYSDVVFQNDEIFKSGMSSFSIDNLRANHKLFMEKDHTVDADAAGLFPELEDAMAAFPEQRFNLNFPDKSPEITSQFAKTITGMKADDRILASSIHGSIIKKIHSQLPELPTSFSFTGIVGFYALYRSGFIFFKKNFTSEALIMHEMIGASFLAGPGMIGEAKKRGIRVYILNVDNYEQVRRLREAGSDGYVTGSIETVRNALA
jgi:glycerophosphoryl diester phosphodiesterase